MCASMVDIQSATAEIRRGKKEEEDRNHRAKICLRLLRRAAIINNGTLRATVAQMRDNGSL